MKEAGSDRSMARGCPRMEHVQYSGSALLSSTSGKSGRQVSQRARLPERQKGGCLFGGQLAPASPLALSLFQSGERENARLIYALFH